MKRAIQILLVDDHQVVRDGLQRMLEQEEDLEVVGQSSNADETLNRIDELSPDIVLMDIKMPGMDGIELTRLVKKRHPTCNVIMLTLYEQYLTQAMEAGAKGYLLKDIKRRELAQAIRQVSGGQVVTSESIKAHLAGASEDKPVRHQMDSYVTPVGKMADAILADRGYQAMQLADTVNINSQVISQAAKQVHQEVAKSVTPDVYKDSRKDSDSTITTVDEIQVVLPPLVEASLLMKLAYRIEEMFHSRVLQMVGSWQEGAIMTVALHQAAPLSDIVAIFKRMPEVGDAVEQPPTQTVSPALFGKAEAIHRLSSKNCKPVFLTFDKTVVEAS